MHTHSSNEPSGHWEHEAGDRWYRDGWYDDASYCGDGWDERSGRGPETDEWLDEPFDSPKRLKRGLWFALGLLIGIIAGVGADRHATPALEAGRSLVGSDVDDGEPGAAEDRQRITEPAEGGDHAGLGQGEAAAETAVAAGTDGNIPLPVEASETIDDQATGEGQVVVAPPAASGCAIDSSGLPVVDLVNESTVLADFLLTIALHDGAGITLSQQPAEIYALRPGERTIEHVVVQEPGGVDCEVVESNRLPVEVTAASSAEVAPCEITGPNAAGEMAAAISIVNSGEATSDFLVDLAFVDPSGFRRGTGVAIADGLNPATTVRVDVDTFVAYTPELVCQVVGVTRDGGLTSG